MARPRFDRFPAEQQDAVLDAARREFVTHGFAAASLNRIIQAAGVSKGSATPHTTKVAKLTRAQVEEIARTKEPDLNANDLDAAVKIVAGTARSMGITVED